MRLLILVLIACLSFCGFAFALTVPGFTGGNTCSEGNNCPTPPGNDHVEPIVVNTAGNYRFDVSGTFFVVDMKLGTTPCSANITEVNGACGGNDYITCIFLNVGTYYLTLDCSAACCGSWQVNVTTCTVAPGETAANPIIISSLPYNVNGNTDCHDSDVNNVGCPSQSTGGDIFYRYTPATNYTLNISMNQSGIPPFYDVLIINGTCYAPSGCCSNVSNYPATPGVPIDIVVDACCRRGQSYNLQVTENLPPPCVPFCESYPQETETCANGYIDAFNGGCDETTPAFIPFPCGSSICARSGTYVTSGVNHADNDWYEFVVTQTRNVTFYYRTEFQAHPRVYRRGPNGCVDKVLVREDNIDSCALFQYTIQLDPATYWIAMSPQAVTGVSCGKKYTLLLTCAPPACQIDRCGSPIFINVGTNYDSTMNNCCLTDPIPSVYTNGCFTTSVNSGPDIIHFVWLFSPDTFDVIASGSGDVQIYVCGFCSDPVNTCVASRDLLGAGQGESILGLVLQPGFYYVSTSTNGACGNVRTQILFTPPVLNPPTHLVIEPISTNIRLDWNRVTGAAQYHIHRDTTASITPTPGNLIGSTTDSTYIDTGIIGAAQTKYFYVVTTE